MLSKPLAPSGWWRQVAVVNR